MTIAIAGALVAAAWAAFRSAAAGRETATEAQEWARHLGYEEARASFEKGRDMMVDHFVDPRRSLVRSNRERREITDRAVAARSRMNEIAGWPHGPDFRVGYRAAFVLECERIADAVHEELGRKLAQLGPLSSPGAEPRSATGASQAHARARSQ